MIGIIDYGMGNLFSIRKALERLDVEHFISDDKRALMHASGLILPGVGSFKKAMVHLNQLGLTEMVKQYAEQGKPLLGICLGMQLLFERSDENGHTTGLGLLPGKVRRLDHSLAYKVPHMGWNNLYYARPSRILSELDEDFVYFVHAYYVDTDDPDVMIASCHYGIEVPAIVGKKNIIGMQFHPEKSGQLGIKLLRNFTEVVVGRGKAV
ncbi:imidazole glycerol phosphate synthase subunit HisH [Hazenella sp. IB182357]|uniref:Imidazole glycerol phosphate synthase subunit HisH n=1 Tax=Polycladospora coralii TaxID=2771432 RepID=A0A926N6C6_9BACL|nr:imidazole glycerol phosphate synthase subunit HisH [Polycladospora coralii]